MIPDNLFDYLLAPVLVWLAWRVLSNRDGYKSTLLFVTFGLLLALTWVRLNAPDIALAEAAIAAGLIGALLLDAVGQIEQRRSLSRLPGRGPVVKVVYFLCTATVFGLLAATVLDLPRDPGGLTALAGDALDDSGVGHPATAVLLNFRAWDTLVEVAVLLLAALGIQALAGDVDAHEGTAMSPPNVVLPAFAAFVVPLALVAAGYLLWLGTHAPGGAFQAGAIVAAAGVLLRLSGYRSVAAISVQVLRPLLALGLVTFLLVGMAAMALGRAFIEYPPGAAGTLIVLVEAAVALSVGVILATLFVGARPPETLAEQTQEEPAHP